MRYCRGVDRADEDLINSAFHADAIDDHGTPRPATKLARGVATGRQRQLMHFTGNVLIELDGDTAFVESYFISFSPHDEDGVTSTRTRAGRYLDRFERRDGEWKIAYRRVVDEWARLDVLMDIPEGVGVHAGVRGPEDLVYHMRERLK
jgi:SnoaL-like domain